MSLEELFRFIEHHWGYISINKWKDSPNDMWVVSNTTHPLRFTSATLKGALQKAVDHIKQQS